MVATRLITALALLSSVGAFRLPATARLLFSPPRNTVPCLSASDEPEPEAVKQRAAPENYDEAESRGLELAGAGEYERAIRMFELAQTLPGAGIDYNRQKQGGMIGSATAPPNPREWGERRYATPEQKLIAQYNIACCCAGMGDVPRALELLRDYLSKVSEPLKQVNQMLVDEDLVILRPQLQALRQEFKTDNRKPGLFGFPGLRNPLRDAADSIGVEWKD